MDSLNPKTIPLFKKQNFLKSFSEDDFRDQIVRPLYLLKGLEHGKDVCGPTEDGKDCYFFGKDAFRPRILYAIQTKRGDIKMSSSHRENVAVVAAQLQTALTTPVRDLVTKEKLFPDCVVLVVSGEVNDKAQTHIVEQVKDPRVMFIDCNQLINEIDQLMPEIWYGIDTKTVPYLRRLRQDLEARSDFIDVSELGVDNSRGFPSTDDSYIQLYLHRYSEKVTREHGHVKRVPDIEQIPIQDVLQRSERLILISGEAGSGKTHSLRRIAIVLIDKAFQEKGSPDIPVFISAAELARNNDRILDDVARHAARLNPDGSWPFSKESLDLGNVTVLIDGFDEVAVPELRESLLERLAAFHAQYPRCRIILTSRDHTFLHETTQRVPFVRFHISPINFNQTKRLVERLSRGKSLSTDATNELLRRLENVHGLELNPLLVTVFVSTSDYQRQDIPANITELFKKFTEMMLGRWDQSKGLAQQFHAPLKDFLLSQLAFTMHRAKSVSIALAAAEEIIANELRERGHETEVSQLFEEIVYRSGLIRIVDGELQFRHLLLQEFFAGRCDFSSELLHLIISDPWWMRAIVFHFGENPDNHTKLRGLIQAVGTLNGGDLYQAAITTGLALQACYLTKTADKLDILKWTVHALASTRADFTAHLEKTKNRTPILSFIEYYVFARDSVGAKVIKQVTEIVEAEDEAEGTPAELHDARMFWCIAGLLESGQLDEAKELIHKYKPSDPYFMLALDITCFHVWKLQECTKEKKKLAENMHADLTKRIGWLRDELLQEMRTYLLELRSGELKSLDFAGDGPRALPSPTNRTAEMPLAADSPPKTRSKSPPRKRNK